MENANIDQGYDQCLRLHICSIHTANFLKTAAGKRATPRRAGRRNARNRYVHFRRASNPVAALFIMLSRGITPHPLALVRSFCILLDAAPRRSSLRKTASTRMYILHMHHRSLSRRQFQATTTTAITMPVHALITQY